MEEKVCGSFLQIWKTDSKIGGNTTGCDTTGCNTTVYNTSCITTNVSPRVVLQPIILHKL